MLEKQINKTKEKCITNKTQDVRKGSVGGAVKESELRITVNRYVKEKEKHTIH